MLLSGRYLPTDLSNLLLYQIKVRQVFLGIECLDKIFCIFLINQNFQLLYMFLVLAYSLSQSLNVLHKGARLSLPLVLGHSAPLFYLLDIFEHLLLLLDELLFKLFKLDVDDVEFLFVFYVGLAEAICKLLRFCYEQLAVVLGILVRVHEFLLQLKL